MFRIKSLILAAALGVVWSVPSVHADTPPESQPGVSANDAARKKRLERDVAELLFAYTSVVAAKGGDAFENFTPQDPYILGYLYFKKGDHAKAKPLLEQAIKEGSFSPQSHYILADIVWKKYQADGNQGDLSEAYSQLASAIAENPDYSSPYYLRAILRWGHDHQSKEALEDLTKATALGRGNCYGVHDPKEIDKVWRRSDTKEIIPGLQKIQENCVATHHLEEAVKRLQAKPGHTP